jgi:hypothetical protein
MYSQENGPPRRHGRLLINLEHQLEDRTRPRWLFEELQGELETEKEALDEVDSDLDDLAHDGGDGGACIEGHHSPWR